MTVRNAATSNDKAAKDWRRQARLREVQAINGEDGKRLCDHLFHEYGLRDVGDVHWTPDELEGEVGFTTLRHVVNARVVPPTDADDTERQFIHQLMLVDLIDGDSGVARNEIGKYLLQEDFSASQGKQLVQTVYGAAILSIFGSCEWGHWL
ncbi:hypothetical protein HDU79_001209, partial [Rhizoclosmatium sp. JEL0117]